VGEPYLADNFGRKYYMRMVEEVMESQVLLDKQAKECCSRSIKLLLGACSISVGDMYLQ
jgi:hypothetical protein